METKIALYLYFQDKCSHLDISIAFMTKVDMHYHRACHADLLSPYAEIVSRKELQTEEDLNSYLMAMDVDDELDVRGDGMKNQLAGFIVSLSPKFKGGLVMSVAELTKKFNEQAGSLENAEILVVSMDLPFNQTRWCGAEGVENVTALSAHQCTKFGEDYGVLIAGGPLNRVLARAIFVIDGEGTLKHVEYVSEIAEHPNYEAALAAV